MANTVGYFLGSILPGKNFKFDPAKADTNYLLLGLMIETLNGDTLPAIFRRRVFDPAGMSPKDTYCDLTHLVCRPMLLLDRPMF